MKTISRGALRAAVLALVALLAGSEAMGNGRFPAASFLVLGPGADARLMILRTTFGLVVSDDFGVSWHWSCEDAYGASGMYDPPVAIGGDGTFVAGIPDGIMVSPTRCAWARPTGDPRVQIMDFAADATGHTLAAAMGPFTADNGLSVSNDDGHTWRAGATRPSFFIETVEVAPSDPMRMYISGYAIGAVTLILRSDDGGTSMREVTRDLAGGVDAFIAGVDPTHPDVVYVRSNRELGTYLLKSTDGGAHLTRIFATNRRMLGFALSEDGQTVWAGSEDRTEGIFRSVRGGPFERVGPSLNLSCLRYHAGVLFACASEEIDGFSLGYSTDGGEHFSPVMSLRDVQAPACPRGTPVADTCNPLWPAQQRVLTTLDAAVAPMRGIDAAVFARPDVVTDVGSDVSSLDGGDGTVLADSAADATEVIVRDASDDATTDATLTDSPSDTVVSDVVRADVAAPIDAATDRPTATDRPDTSVVDVRVSDVTAPSTPSSNCGCRTGAPRETHAAWGLLWGLLAFRSRARRRASESPGVAVRARP